MSPPAFLDVAQLQRVANFLGIAGPPKAQPTVRVGVMGASQVATYAMLWPARRVPHAEIVAVAARDGERARDYAKQHGIPRAYGSYDALLADPDVDAVYVGLPNGLHGQWTRAALEAGKHVLCEKPFTANEDEAREVQALARKRGLLCREAFHYREHPMMQHLTALLQPGAPAAAAVAAGAASLAKGAQGHGGSGKAGGPQGGWADFGALGRLSAIEVAVLIPKWVFGGTNIRFQETLAGGAAMDAGCYCLHAIRSLAGGQPEVEAARAVMAPNSQVVDGSMTGSLRWPASDPARGGLRATFRASLQHDGLFPVSTIDLRGDRGSLHCSNFIMPIFGNVVRLTTTDNGSGGDGSGTTTTTRVYGSGESTYYYQLSRFVRDVEVVKKAAEGGEPRSLEAASRLLREDELDSVANMRLLDRVYLAAGLEPRLPSAQALARQKQQQKLVMQEVQEVQGQAV